MEQEFWVHSRDRAAEVAGCDPQRETRKPERATERDAGVCCRRAWTESLGSMEQVSQYWDRSVLVVRLDAFVATELLEVNFRAHSHGSETPPPLCFVSIDRTHHPRPSHAVFPAQIV